MLDSCSFTLKHRQIIPYKECQLVSIVTCCRMSHLSYFDILHSTAMLYCEHAFEAAELIFRSNNTDESWNGWYDDHRSGLVLSQQIVSAQLALYFGQCGVLSCQCDVSMRASFYSDGDVSMAVYHIILSV